MKITLKPVLRKQKPDAKSYCPIAISITGGGERTYFTTDISCPASHWVGRKIKKGISNYDAKNQRIETMIKDAERNILNMQMQGEDVTLERVVKLFNPERVSGDFLKFYRDYIDNLIATNKKAKGTVAIWETQYKELIAHYKKDKLPYSAITTDFLNNYHRSIADTKVTTQHKKLKKLRQIIALAIEAGHINRKQVSGFEMIKYKKPDRDYLTLDETDKISAIIYNGDLDNEVELKKVACFFLVECYGGIRISDWRSFKVEKLIHGDSFKCRTNKNREPVYLPLVHFPRLRRILDYIQANSIVYDITDQATNRLLRKVIKEAKITGKVITSHNGRHTFGTLLGEMRWTTAEIAEAMGISENTAKTYVRHLRDKVKNAAERMGGL